MADCSKLIEFIGEKSKMCMKYLNCKNCPLMRGNNGTQLSCRSIILRYPDKAINIVQKWSDKNNEEVK